MEIKVRVIRRLNIINEIAGFSNIIITDDDIIKLGIEKAKENKMFPNEYYAEGEIEEIKING